MNLNSISYKRNRIEGLKYNASREAVIYLGQKESQKRKKDSLLIFGK